MSPDGSFLVPFLRLTKPGEPQEDREVVCEWTGVIRITVADRIEQEPPVIHGIEAHWGMPRVTEVDITVDLLVGSYNGPQMLSGFVDYGVEFHRPQAPIDPLSQVYEPPPGELFMRSRYSRANFTDLSGMPESFTLTAKPGSKGVIYTLDLVQQEN